MDKAKNMLNEMIEEVMEKYDLELQSCCDFDETQSALMEETRQAVTFFNAEAAEARKEALEATAFIQMCETKLPELNDALAVHNAQCEDCDCLRPVGTFAFRVFCRIRGICCFVSVCVGINHTCFKSLKMVALC